MKQCAVALGAFCLVFFAAMAGTSVLISGGLSIGAPEQRPSTNGAQSTDFAPPLSRPGAVAPALKDIDIASIRVAYAPPPPSDADSSYSIEADDRARQFAEEIWIADAAESNEQALAREIARLYDDSRANDLDAPPLADTPLEDAEMIPVTTEYGIY